MQRQASETPTSPMQEKLHPTDDTTSYLQDDNTIYSVSRLDVAFDSPPLNSTETMVKFSFLALASALAASSASAGTTQKTIKLGHRNLRRGDPATEALLKKAAPYKKGGAKKVHRRAEDAEFEITGSYSLQFSQCIDVKVRVILRDLFVLGVDGDLGKLYATARPHRSDPIHLKVSTMKWTSRTSEIDQGFTLTPIFPFAAL